MDRRTLIRTGLKAAGLAALAAACDTIVAPTPTPAAPTTTPTAPAATVAPRPRVYNVRDFGAVGDGVADDAPAIARAIEAAMGNAGATVSLPAGRYSLATSTVVPILSAQTREDEPRDHPVIERIPAFVAIRGATDLTLEGEPGTVLVPRDFRGQALVLDHCRDVTVRQLAIDYDPLPFVQGTITGVDPRQQWIDWRVDRGFVRPDDARVWPVSFKFGIVRSAASGKLKLSTVPWNLDYVYLRELEARGSDTYRVGVSWAAPFEPGDKFIVTPRPGVWGSTSVQCESCTFDSVTMHSAPALAFFLNCCDGMTVTNCVIAPPPGSERLISSNADGFFVRSNRRGPRIEGCRLTKMGDDSANIHLDPRPLVRQESPTELLVGIWAEPLRVGDHLAVASGRGEGLRGTATITDLALVERSDIGLALRVRIDRTIPGLEPAIGANGDKNPRPDLVGDLDTRGSGFVIRGNSFVDHRDIGLRIRSASGLIEGNRFEDLPLNGVEVGHDETEDIGELQDLTIRDNTFTHIPADSAVRLYTRAADGNESRRIEIHDVTIEGNSFEGYGPRGAIAVSNAEHVTIRGNRFGEPDTRVARGPAVALELCRDILLEANSGIGGAAPVVTFGRETDRGSVIQR